MAVKCAGHTEFGLDTHNPPLHLIERTGFASLMACKARLWIKFGDRGPAYRAADRRHNHLTFIEMR
jgi:hypothetical protein